MKSFLIIGVGRFGKHLGEKLIELDNDVVIIDKDDEVIEKLEGITCGFKSTSYPDQLATALKKYKSGEL